MTFNFEFNESSTNFPIYFPDTIVGPKGDKGDTGNGIASTVLNADYTLTITFTDGTTYTTAPIRGAKGDTGDPGPVGPSGPTQVVVGGVEQSTVTFISDPQTQIDGKLDSLSEGSGIDITNNTVSLDINSLDSTSSTSTSDVVPIYRNNSTEAGNKKLTLSKIADFVKDARGLINSTELATALTAKQDVIGSITVTLYADDWEDNEQTVSATGVTASNKVVISPAPASFSDYTSAVIYCSAQSAGTLAFTCSNAPTSDVVVNVMIVG